MARPRSEEAHRKVMEAAMTLFAERGPESTSMDAIAETSGVSKATIYKHWPNKDALLLESLGYLFGADEKHAVPDTGSLREDLIVRLSHAPAADRKRVRDRLMPHVIAYAARNPAFGAAWRERAMAPLITALSEWMEREQKRGTLQKTIEKQSAIAMLVGPLMYRNIFHRQSAARRAKFAPGLERDMADAFLALHGTGARAR